MSIDFYHPMGDVILSMRTRMGMPAVKVSVV